MSLLRKKLNSIQGNDGQNICQADDNNDQTKSNISPNDVLLLTKITDEYLCSPGKWLCAQLALLFLGQLLSLCIQMPLAVQELRIHKHCNPQYMEPLIDFHFCIFKMGNIDVLVYIYIIFNHIDICNMYIIKYYSHFFDENTFLIQYWISFTAVDPQTPMYTI